MTCRQIHARGVRCAVHPVVTIATQRNDVALIKPKVRVAGPSANVMRVQAPRAFFTRAAADAPVTVACIDSTLNALPFRRSIKTLSFGRTPVSVIGGRGSGAARHAVRVPSKVRFFDGSLSAQHRLRFWRMALPGKRVRNTRPSHVVVSPRQVQPARSGQYAEVSQLFMNPLGIPANDRADLVGGKPLNFVLLPKPCWVEMRRFFIHSRTITDSIGRRRYDLSLV